MNATTNPMSAAQLADLKMTISRRHWLEHLSKARGFVSWEDMPRAGTGMRAVDNRTWGPMLDAGWIEAEFLPLPETTRHQWFFRITEAGYAAMAPSPAASVEGL